MGDKKKTEIAELENNNAKDSGYYTAEELREKLYTPLAEFEGTKTMQGWKQGRQITEAEYRKAVAQFNSATAGRR